MEIERNIKQFIIIREDLDMSPGKAGAQISHAAKKVWFDKFKVAPPENIVTPVGMTTYYFNATQEEVDWIEGGFTTILKKVKNENKLLKAFEAAKEAGLNCTLIKDAGLTDLEGENYTAIAIGPNHIDKCEPIVKRLRNL